MAVETYRVVCQQGTDITRWFVLHGLRSPSLPFSENKRVLNDTSWRRERVKQALPSFSTAPRIKSRILSTHWCFSGIAVPGSEVSSAEDFLAFKQKSNLNAYWWECRPILTSPEPSFTSLVSLRILVSPQKAVTNFLYRGYKWYKVWHPPEGVPKTSFFRGHSKRMCQAALKPLPNNGHLPAVEPGCHTANMLLTISSERST